VWNSGSTAQKFSIKALSQGSRDRYDVTELWTAIMFSVNRSLRNVRQEMRRQRVAEALLELRCAQMRSLANGLHPFAYLDGDNLSTASEQFKFAASDDDQR